MKATSVADSMKAELSEQQFTDLTEMEKEEMLETMEREMLSAAERLDFERAAELRDDILLLRGAVRKTGKRSRYARRSR